MDFSRHRKMICFSRRAFLRSYYQHGDIKELIITLYDLHCQLWFIKTKKINQTFRPQKNK